MNIMKPLAVKLRADGYSYRMIHKELGIPMSTMSGWFRDAPYTPNQEALQRIESGRYAHGIMKREERLREINQLLIEGRKEVGTLSKRDLWMVGLGLWIGEGSKTIEQIRLANSDPKVIALWIRWLKDACHLNNDNIFATLHIYPESNEFTCKNYWKNVTQIQNLRFGKTQIDHRSNKSKDKKGSLPYGTIHISVRSAGNPSLGVKLYRRMKGWISAILD